MPEWVTRNKQGAITELGHEPRPGYRTACYLAFAVGVLYLLLAFTGIIPPGGDH
jgi:hypothetical protein